MSGAGDGVNTTQSSSSMSLHNDSTMSGNGVSGTTMSSARSKTVFGHDREQVSRILIQGLHDMGYEAAAQALVKESGYDLEAPFAASLREAVIDGDWAEAEAIIMGADGGFQENGPHDGSSGDITYTRKALLLDDNASKEDMLFDIKEQKYLELLERKDLTTALFVLRQELHPLQQDERRFHALSSYMMFQSPEDLKARAGWDGASGQSRQLLFLELTRSIHPSMMIPEHRLFELLTQVKEANINNDPYHNSKLWPSLYVDHVDSDLDDFPLRQKVKLKRHTDEVWALAFSNDGTRLATGGKDSLVVIYETETFQILHIFEGLTGAVAYLSWSPDDTKLIICGQMSYPDAGGRARVSTHAVEIWNPENATRIAVLSMFMEPVSSAAWAPDGKTFVTSSMDDQLPLVSGPADATSIKDMIHIFEGSYEGPIDFRCQDCALAGVSPPSNSVFAAPDQPIDRNNQPIRLVAISNSTFIHIFDYRTHTQLNVINMDTKMTSINLSRDGQEMLLNFAEGEVQTRDENFNVKKRFEGQKHGSFVIRSCFGAAQETVVVSGSEDGKVNIWHRHSGRLLRSLTAHPAIGGPNGTSTSCVNAVSWNTANPSMFASAGDDRMVIVWLPKISISRMRAIESKGGKLAPKPSSYPPGSKNVSSSNLSIVHEDDNNGSAGGSAGAGDGVDTASGARRTWVPFWGEEGR